jgi:hypothetical protein
MCFEVYRRGQHVNGSETKPFVTVCQGTRLLFNRPCAEFLGDSSHALCLFDSETRRVAVQGCSNDYQQGYRIYKPKSRAQAYMSARALLGKLGIADRKRIPVEIADGMLQFSIDWGVINMNPEPIDREKSTIFVFKTP